MTRWEYRVYRRTAAFTGEQLEETLNVHGDDGWEAIDIQPNRVVFKRPITHVHWIGTHAVGDKSAD